MSADGGRRIPVLVRIVVARATGIRTETISRRQPRQGARVVAFVVAVSALGACAPDGPQLVAPTTLSSAEQPSQIDGLTATLEQYREDEIQSLISVQTTNRSSSTVLFSDLRLEWDGLSDEAPVERSTQLGPGVTFDLRVRQGHAVCGTPPEADGAPPPGAPLAVGHASVDGGPPQLVAVPIEDRRSILPRVYRTSCQAQRLAWAVDLDFGDEWTPTTTASGKPGVLGTLEVRRSGSDAPLAITRVDGSVLLRVSPAAPSDPLLDLAPDRQAASIPILVEQSGNCTAHALAERKKTFFIPVGVAIGDEEPAADVLTFDAPAKQLLNHLINESCGVG